MINQEGQKEVLLAYHKVLSCFLSTSCQGAEKNMTTSIRIMGILNKLESWDLLNLKEECQHCAILFGVMIYNNMI